MIASLLAVLVLNAPPTDVSPAALMLLKTFRSEFVRITPGEGIYPRSFKMGSGDGPLAERPPHTVTIPYSFSIARYEVPQNLWSAVMGKNPSRWKGERNSVEMLSFAEATEFCRRATAAMRSANLIAADEVIRLPSEAEWEYASRAGTDTRYSFGDAVDQLGEYGWYTGNAAGNDPAVGEKKPNPLGLYDVHGYLWEWCTDYPHANYEGAPQDGTSWTKGGDETKRVLRGGSWRDTADRVTSSFRLVVPAGLRDDATGLRCVLAKEK